MENPETRVLPLSDFPLETRREIRGLFFDIDDTLTTDGRLTADAYSALERLHEAGLMVVPITGRPAGWCDHIARMWPVAGVIGENGAFHFRYDRTARRMLRSYVQDAATRATQREQLRQIGDSIVASVPGCAIAADQLYRETDLAIDFREDVAPLAREEVDRVVALMQARGLTAKVSSIHVNGWFGSYDKLVATKRMMLEEFGLDLDRERGSWVFAGDSPNDAPMFGYFPHAVGVANVREFAGRLAHEPKYVTAAAAGAGFCELADFLLAART
jgi:HAD superfamily hydrolase (TIGR01484 family)